MPQKPSLTIATLPPAGSAVMPTSSEWGVAAVSGSASTRRIVALAPPDVRSDQAGVSPLTSQRSRQSLGLPVSKCGVRGGTTKPFSRRHIGGSRASSKPRFCTSSAYSPPSPAWLISSKKIPYMFDGIGWPALAASIRIVPLAAAAGPWAGAKSRASTATSAGSSGGIARQHMQALSAPQAPFVGPTVAGHTGGGRADE
jgi:hypothetical protein